MRQTLIYRLLLSGIICCGSIFVPQAPGNESKNKPDKEEGPIVPTIRAKGPSDEAAAPITAGFTEIQRIVPVDNETRFSVEYDERYLIIDVWCYDDEMDSLTVDYLGRDSDVWSDDCVEIFIDPGLTRKKYWHLIVNPKGGVLDEYCIGGNRDKVRNIDGMRLSIIPREDHWFLRASLPIGSLYADPPKPGDIWGINVARHEVKENREDSIYSSWSPIVVGGFHQTERFGRLCFSYCGDMDQK